MRVFAPLKDDHPLVSDAVKCPLCWKPFQAGERVVLAAARDPQQGVENVPAIPCHATCALKGAKTRVGTILRIKDGNGSPYPVITDDGKQWKLTEAGYTE